MHRNDGTADTPEPDPSVPYFTPQHFDPPEMFDDETEDSDALIRNAAGVAPRRMPTKDHTFEERKWKIRQRIIRQKVLLSKIKRDSALPELYAAVIVFAVIEVNGNSKGDSALPELYAAVIVFAVIPLHTLPARKQHL